MVSQKLVKENFYKEAFDASLARDEEKWLRELRENAFAHFSENDFPTSKDEEWKYTNIAALAGEKWKAGGGNLKAYSVSRFVFDESKESILVFTNGAFDKNLSNLNAVQDAAVMSFSDAAKGERYAEIFKAKLARLVDSNKNAFTALNAAFIGEGVFVHLPKNAKIDAPIQLLFLTDDNAVSFPRILIVAEEFAEATFVETFNRVGDETKYLTSTLR